MKSNVLSVSGINIISFTAKLFNKNLAVNEFQYISLYVTFCFVCETH